MPFTYAAFQKSETDPTAEVFPVTDHNMLPLMVLWLAVTLDVGGQYTPSKPGETPHPGIDDKQFTALATGMGLTADTARSLLKLARGTETVPLKTHNGYANLRDVFAATAGVFAQHIAMDSAPPNGYDGPYCPQSLAGLQRLAKVGELAHGLADPGQGTHPIPR